MVSRWWVVDGDVIVNTVLWDGESDYEPGPGLHLVAEGTPGLSHPPVLDPDTEA